MFLSTNTKLEEFQNLKWAQGSQWKKQRISKEVIFYISQGTQELDIDIFLYLYTLYVVEGRTVTPLLHKLFLGELHRYYSGYNLVRIPFE